MPQRLARLPLAARSQARMLQYSENQAFNTSWRPSRPSAAPQGAWLVAEAVGQEARVLRVAGKNVRKRALK